MGKIYNNRITTTAGFNFPAKAPLDDRAVVESYSDLNTLVTDNQAYEGMSVYVVEDKKAYRLIGTEWEPEDVLKSGEGENSIQQVGTEAEAFGEASAAFGLKTIAMGDTAFIAGWSSNKCDLETLTTEEEIIAAWDDAHAKRVDRNYPGYTGDSVTAGVFAIALGTGSHVEGDNSIAANTGHAEGRRTKAIGLRAHAEGTDTAAINNNTHAEGQDTIASGNVAHAEGYRTEAKGDHSHAEGVDTRSIGITSHAEGTLTEAIGSSSHAEGEGSIARGGRSHAGGYKSHAIGSQSFAFGDNAQTGQEILMPTTLTIDHFAHLDFIESDSTSFLILAERLKASEEYPYAYSFDGKELYAKAKLQTEYGTSYWNGDYYYFNGSEFVSDTGYVIELVKDDGPQGDVAYTGTLEYSDSLSKPEIIGATNSVAFGNHTQAASSNQFVAGKYNVIDTTGKYAFIIGNGSSSTPSNAMSLDWSGNGQFKGDVKAGDVSLKSTQTVAAQAKALADIKPGQIITTTVEKADGTPSKKVGVILNTSFGNSATGNGSIAGGYLCKALNDHDMSFGTQSEASGQLSTTIGHGLKTQTWKQTVMGTYNALDTNQLFILGCGTNDSDRKNAFTIAKSTGNAWFRGNVQVAGGKLTVGNTEFTEAQLQKILKFINTIEDIEE